RRDVPFGAEEDESDLLFVVPQLEERLVELAEGRERPPRCAERADGRRVARQVGCRTPERQRGRALVAIDRQQHVLPAYRVRLALPRGRRRAAPSRRASGGRCGERLRATLDGLVEPALGS